MSEINIPNEIVESKNDIHQLREVLDTRDFDYFQGYVIEYLTALGKSRSPHMTNFGKTQFSDTPELRMIHEKLMPVASQIFQTTTLLPSWSVLDIYEGPASRLNKEVYDSACTYAVSILLYQRFPWEITLNGDSPFELVENDGLFFYGNRATRSREPWTTPDGNVLAEATFFFVEPDHWWFTEGENYLYDVIRAPKP